MYTIVLLLLRLVPAYCRWRNVFVI